MARIKVTDPEGSEWRVWRRWYAWRRWVTLRDIWKALPGTNSGGYDSSSSELDLLFALPIVAIGLVVTLVDLAAQLIALPFIVIARLLRLASWPVELNRKDKFIRTLRTKGFGAAGGLRDELVRQVQSGTLPDVPPLDRPAAEAAQPGQEPPAQTPPAQGLPAQTPPAPAQPEPPLASHPGS